MYDGIFEFAKAQRKYWKDKKAGKDISCVSCHNDTTMPGFAHTNLLETLQNENQNEK